MLQKLKIWYDDVFNHRRSVQDIKVKDNLTLGIPVRMLENTTGEEPPDELVYAISKEELLKFLHDNDFKPIP